MAEMCNLTDKAGGVLYPKTITDGVYTSDGKTMTEVLTSTVRTSNEETVTPVIKYSNADKLGGRPSEYYAASGDLERSNDKISENSTSIRVLSSRMDTFSSLESGSTTGDAELIDIRVKADGTTAATAGDAVREQVNELKGDIKSGDELGLYLIESSLLNLGQYSYAEGRWIKGNSTHNIGTGIIKNEHNLISIIPKENNTKIRFYLVKYRGPLYTDIVSQTAYYEPTYNIDISDFEYFQIILQNNGYGNLYTENYNDYCIIGFPFIPKYLSNYKKSNKLSIPNKIRMLVEKELNIYYDNLLLDDRNLFDINIDGDNANKLSNKVRYNSATVKTFNGTIKVTLGNRNNRDLIDNTSYEIKYLSPYNGTNKNRKLLMIGDSNTFNLCGKGYIQEAIGNLNIDTIGTQISGSYSCEGYPGKTSEYIVGNQSPFYNPSNKKFDFSYYMNNNSFSSVDYVTIMFGTNDLYSVGADITMYSYIENIVNRYNTIIQSIHEYNSAIKVCVMLTIFSAESQNGYVNIEHKRFKRNIHFLNERLLTEFCNIEDSNIYVIPTNICLDTKYNYEHITTNANDYNSTDKIEWYSNVLHPMDSGYHQLADVIRGLINYLEQ